MIIANELKKTNIAEYVLYMWQIEDLIRLNNFNIDSIKESIISKYDNSQEIKKSIEQWYEGLIDLMGVDNIKYRGHFQFLTDIINELDNLHLKLINNIKDENYIKSFTAASDNIAKLKEKSKNKDISDIEVCFNGMYGLLIMRLKKQNVSNETTQALATISGMLGVLSSIYLQDINDGK